MTGVRDRSTVDRSILDLSSRQPEVATGFLRWWLDRLNSREPTRGAPVRHPCKTNEAAHVVDEVRHSDFAPRADDADGAHELGSHAVLLITKYMLDADAHIRDRL